MPKVEIVDVSHYYTRGDNIVHALQDINLNIEEGEFCSIVGPSGCGKTTLLFATAGFIRPTSGIIRVDGALVEKPGPDRGVVFQSFALFKWLTVRGNVEFGLKMRGVSAKKRRERADYYLQMVGLAQFGDRYVYELSGGMQQRTAIARAFANDPEILLMDEPFGSLDAQSREMMQEELFRIWKENKKTVIFITHSVDEAIFLSNRVVVFTFRPGSIKYIQNIDLPDNRFDFHIRTTQEFIDIKKAVLDLVREETMKQQMEEGRL